MSVRPIYHDCWGYLWSGGFTGVTDEDQARTIIDEHPVLTLARTVNGRVCDEHGEPFEVAL